MVERIRQQHRLGRQVIQAREAGKSIADLAERYPYSEHTLRKIRAFAEQYSDSDLDELCEGRRPNGLPLHWGYIPILLAIEAKRGKLERKRFQARAIKKGWSVAELRRAMRQKIGIKGHGRTMAVPEDLNAALQDLAENVDFLQRRCRVLMLAAHSKGNDNAYLKAERLSSLLSKASAIVAK